MTAVHTGRHHAADHPARRAALNGAARLGLTARAVIYLLIGGLALAVAAGHSTRETDQWGAFEQLNRSRPGHVALWVVALGLAGYALWRFSEAALGTADGERSAGPRAKSFFRGCVYGFFAANAFQVAVGRPTTSQAHRQESLTATVMQHTGGRLAVAVAGAVVVAIGLFLVVEGVTRKFEKSLDTAAMSGRTRRVVRFLGTVGTSARGAVFALAGVFVIQAAKDYKPSKAAGLDGALRALRDTPAGPWLLGVFAAGLIAFGVYGLAEARWRRT
jgi:uncharacterized membrane protein